MTSPETRILSIDYGLKRVGLALCDPLKIFAYPYKTLKNDKGFFNELTKLIKEQNVIKVILGFPDTDNISAKEVRNKIISLKGQIEKLNIEVILWDESFTSIIAGERVLQSVTKKTKRRDKGLLDQHSAAIILQEYLDSKVKRRNE
jgi:putative holliday junction resolvase